MSMRRFVGSAVIVICLTPVTLFGLGVRIADQDPFATARGNAFTATADNPSAIYYNPAGITQIEGHNANFSSYGIVLKSTYDSPTGSEYETETEFQAVPHLYYTYSRPDFPVAAGLGLYSPYGLGLEWPDDTSFRTLAKEGRIMYLTLNPVVAWRINETLSVAGGVSVNYSEASLKRGIFTPGDEFHFKGDDWDMGFNAGILWQPHPQHSFGAMYRSATTMEFSGDSKTTLMVPAPLQFTQTASARFHFPQFVVAGWSFRPTTNWNLELNIDWTDWDSLDTVTLRQATGNILLPFNWKSSFFYEFGITRHLPRRLSLSAGYIFSENTVPDSSFNPAVPDSDRHIFSLGIGRQYEKLRWDAAYQLAYGPTRTVSNSPTSPIGETADGRYDFISHAFTFSLGYTF